MDIIDQGRGEEERGKRIERKPALKEKKGKRRRARTAVAAAAFVLLDASPEGTPEPEKKRKKGGKRRKDPGWRCPSSAKFSAFARREGKRGCHADNACASS